MWSSSEEEKKNVGSSSLLEDLPLVELRVELWDWLQ